VRGRRRGGGLPEVSLLHGDLLDGFDEVHLPRQGELVFQALSDLRRSQGSQGAGITREKKEGMVSVLGRVCSSSCILRAVA
jgi:hypothetical protein